MKKMVDETIGATMQEVAMQDLDQGGQGLQQLLAQAQSMGGI
jgi:hypothetical protein